VIGNESIFTTGLTSPFAIPNTSAMIAKVKRSFGKLVEGRRRDRDPRDEPRGDPEGDGGLR